MLSVLLRNCCLACQAKSGKMKYLWQVSLKTPTGDIRFFCNKWLRHHMRKQVKHSHATSDDSDQIVLICSVWSGSSVFMFSMLGYVSVHENLKHNLWSPLLDTQAVKTLYKLAPAKCCCFENRKKKISN